MSFGTAWPAEIREQEEKAPQREVFVGSLRILSVTLIEYCGFLLVPFYVSHDSRAGMCFLCSGFGKRMDKEALFKSPSQNLLLGEKHLLCWALLDQHLDICEHGYYSPRRKTSLGYFNTV